MGFGLFFFSPLSDWKNNLYNIMCMKAKGCDYQGKDTVFPASSNIWGILTLTTVHRLCIECLREKLLRALHPPLFLGGDKG